MASGISNQIEPTRFGGNLAIHASEIPETGGDGSVELSGTLYCDTFAPYNTNAPITIFDSQFTPNDFSCANIAASTVSLSNPLNVASGGIGVSSIQTGRILIGNNSSPISSSPNLTFNQGTSTLSSTNQEITGNLSVSGITLLQTPLSVVSGGSGCGSFPVGNVLFGNSTGAILNTNNFNWNNTAQTLSVTNISVGSNAIISGLLTVSELSGILSLNVANDATFTCAITIGEATSANHAATKGYVDSLDFSGSETILAGTGLSKVNSIISVNPTQPNIVSVGTLNGLNINGVITNIDTTQLSNTSNVITGSQGAVNLSGDLHLTNSGSNTLYFRDVGVGVPTFTTRSLGSKIILSPKISPSSVDYAIGYESSNMWFSTPNNLTGYKWYCGTTPVMTLSTGVLSPIGSLCLTGAVTSTRRNNTNPGWYILGLIDASATTDWTRVTLKINGASGYSTSFGGQTVVYVSINNNINASTANINGKFYSIGDTPALTALKFVQNGGNRFSYYVYANLASLPSMSINAAGPTGFVWTEMFTSTSDPGNDSSTVHAATNMLSVNSPAEFSNTLRAATFLTGWGWIFGNEYGIGLVGGADPSSFISLKANSVASSSPELFFTAGYTALKRNDGTTNSLYVDNNTGVITIDHALNISAAATIQGVTPTEFAQLANINSVSISNSKWAYLGAMNQNIHSTSSPTFTALTISTDLINGRSIANDRTILDTVPAKTDTSWVTAQLALKQNVLSNLANVASIDQNLSTSSDVRVNTVNIGANGYLTNTDGSNQLLISGGISNTNRYVVIRPNTPTSPATGSLITYTSGSFYITKSDGVAQSISIDNSTGDVTIDGLTVTRNINGVTPTEFTQLANINSVTISTAQWTYLGYMNQDVSNTSTPTFQTVVLGSTTANVASATRRDYVDGLSYLTMGTGLSRTGATISVNTTQSQITQVGTLSSLQVSGTLSSGALSATSGTFSSAVSGTSFTGNLIGGTVSGTTVAFSGITNISNTTKLSSSANTISSSSGSLTLAGDLHLYHSINPHLVFFPGTQAAPAFTTRSAGTRLIVYPNLSPSTMDYAIGMESNNLWFSTSTPSTGFKWYGGTTLAAALTGGGALSLASGLSATTGLFSGAISGTSFSGNLIGGTVSGTIGTFSGAVSGTSFSGNLIGGTVSGTTGAFSGITNVSNTTKMSSTENTVNSSSGSLTLAGDLHLYHATNPQLVFFPGSTSAPTFTTRSTGTRLIVSPNISASSVDYAIGLEASNLWFSTSQTTTGFRWYGGTTLAATLSGVGALALASGLSATTGTFSGAISGTSFTGNLIGGTVSGTIGTFSGAVSGTSFSGNLIGGTVSGTTGTFLGAISGTSFSGNLIGGTVSGTIGTFSGAVSGTSFSGNLIGGTVSGTTGAFSGITNVSNTTKMSSTGNSINSSSGSLTLAGDLHLYHATNPQLVFFPGTQAAPSFTTRSAGTRLIVSPNISASSVDYAIGLEASNLWFSTSQSTTGFKWYGGTTLAASLSGDGTLSLTQGLSATTGTFSGAISGTSFTGNLIGGTLSATTGTFANSVTASSFVTSSGLLYTSGNGIVLAGATSANYISMRAQNNVSGEFLITTGYTVLKRNDGLNSLYIDNTNGAITIDNSLNISAAATIQGVTPTEFAQLANINSVSISNTQWAYLGALNQNVHSTSSPTFASVSAANGTLSGTLAVTGNVTLSNMMAVNGGTTETYTLTSSSKGLYNPAGTVATISSVSNSIEGATLVNLSAFNTANIASGVFFGAVAGTAYGAANFVVGRRTGVTSWAESLRVDTVGTLQISSTTQTSSSTTGSIITPGGVGIGKSLYVQDTVYSTNGNFSGWMGCNSLNTWGTLNLISGGNTVSFAPGTISTSYTVTVPPGPPVTNANLMFVDTNGVASFAPPALATVFSTTNVVNGCKIWTGVASVSSGAITVYPTSNNLSNGTAVFGAIIYASATATVNTTTMSSVALAGLRSISADRKSIIFNVVLPDGTAAPNATSVMVFILGY